MVVRSPVRSPVRSVVQSVFGEAEAFNPFQLFTAGAQGAWYDPSDFSTLYQDSAGTTPVTAVEQPVGLMLDRSRGLVLGANIAPTITSESVGTGSISTVGGTTTVTSIDGANYGLAKFAFSAVAGAAYEIKFTLSHISGVTSAYGFATGFAVQFLNTNLSTTGNYTFIGIASGASPNFTLQTASNQLGTFAISAISIKLLPGNHALQATSASRPVLRSRYNALLNTDFALGTTTATNWVFAVPAGITATIEGRGVDANGRGYVDVRYVGTNTSGSNGFPSLQSATATAIAGGVYNVALTVSLVAGSLSGGSGYTLLSQWRQGADLFLSNSAGANRTPTSAPDRYTETHTAPANTTGVKLNWTWTVANGASIDVTFRYAMASLLTAADAAATGNAYQRIAAATVYDTGPPWRPYLAFDGTDDSMSTSSIDFSGTDEMTVFAGVTKLSDAARGVVAELTEFITTPGSFLIDAPGITPATDHFRFVSYGSAIGTANAGASYPAPTTRVVTGIGDISADVATLRVNGVQAATSATDQGTGNYANAPLFIGRRNNTSLPFNGRLYSLAVLGRTATAAEITSMETWVAGKTGVSL